MKNTILIFLFFIYSTNSYGYIDPGILGALYQIVYVFIYGSLLAWIIKPWRYIKSFFNNEEDIDKNRENG